MSGDMNLWSRVGRKYRPSLPSSLSKMPESESTHQLVLVTVFLLRTMLLLASTLLLLVLSLKFLKNPKNPPKSRKSTTALEHLALKKVQKRLRYQANRKAWSKSSSLQNPWKPNFRVLVIKFQMQLLWSKRESYLRNFIRTWHLRNKGFSGGKRPRSRRRHWSASRSKVLLKMLTPNDPALLEPYPVFTSRLGRPPGFDLLDRMIVRWKAIQRFMCGC